MIENTENLSIEVENQRTVLKNDGEVVTTVNDVFGDVRCDDERLVEELDLNNSRVQDTMAEYVVDDFNNHRNQIINTYRTHNTVELEVAFDDYNLIVKLSENTAV